MTGQLLFEDAIEPGATWSHVLKRGTTLTITDATGHANVGVILYNFESPAERLNIPDTLKAQHIAKITSSNVLYSDMGRILVSVIDDSAGWHDPLGGFSDEALVSKKYGALSYQNARNEYYRNARDGFMIELAKWGLGAQDICPCINFFSKVIVDESGTMSFVPNTQIGDRSVTLRSEMNVLAILNTCQHPMDPNTKYAPSQVHLKVNGGNAPSADDTCRLSCPENERGFTLTERYFM